MHQKFLGAIINPQRLRILRILNSRRRTQTSEDRSESFLDLAKNGPALLRGGCGQTRAHRYKNQQLSKRFHIAEQLNSIVGPKLKRSGLFHRCAP